MSQLLFIDTETTGKDEEDRLIQVAYKYGTESCDELFKPPLPIKIAAMAVNHITEKMVADKPAFIGSATEARLREIAHEAIFVAHNAAYDLRMLAKEGVEFPTYICTLKIARHVDGGRFENHQLQYLRYFYGIEVDATAHDAFGDIVVLEAVFARLLQDLIALEFANKEWTDNEVIARMVEISTQPSLMTKINFGKYAKQGITDLAEVARIDKDYLRWLLNEKLKAPEGEEDWIYSLRHYINS